VSRTQWLPFIGRVAATVWLEQPAAPRTASSILRNRNGKPALLVQYQRWPEAAISYFGILVSECEKGLIETHARVRIVPDHVLGTNDSRGWVSQSLFDN